MAVEQGFGDDATEEFEVGQVVLVSETADRIRLECHIVSRGNEEPEIRVKHALR